MTFLIALSVIAAAGAVLLVAAGRESLRINGHPPVRMRSLADRLHLMSIGFRALNEASEKAARRRMLAPW